MTYSSLLASNGWEKINLFENDLNFDEYLLWGHISNPEMRHTKGVAQYLLNNPTITLSDPTVATLLVSGVFDEHTYSLNMMLSNLLANDIYWIPLDAKIINWNEKSTPVLSGDDLTNDFFLEQNIPLRVSLNDRKNVSNSWGLFLQQQINECKIKYNKNYQKLVKNFLESDIILYNKTLTQFRKKYGSSE